MESILMSDLDVEINYQIDLAREQAAYARHQRMNCFSPSGQLLPTHSRRIDQRIDSTMAMNPEMTFWDARIAVMLNYSEETRAAILAE